MIAAVRQTALAEAKERQREGDVAGLIEMLHSDRGADSVTSARTAAAVALGELRATEAETELIGLLKDSSRYARAAAAGALASIATPLALQALAGLLDDSDWLVKGWAVAGLAENGRREALPALVEMLVLPFRHKKRVWALEHIARLGDTSVVEAVDQARRRQPWLRRRKYDETLSALRVKQVDRAPR